MICFKQTKTHCFFVNWPPCSLQKAVKILIFSHKVPQATEGYYFVLLYDTFLAIKSFWEEDDTVGSGVSSWPSQAWRLVAQQQKRNSRGQHHKSHQYMDLQAAICCCCCCCWRHEPQENELQWRLRTAAAALNVPLWMFAFISIVTLVYTVPPRRQSWSSFCSVCRKKLRQQRQSLPRQFTLESVWQYSIFNDDLTGDCVCITHYIII